MGDSQRDAVDVFDQSNVRIEKLIWLPGAVGCGNPSEDFEEFIEEATDGLMTDAVFTALPELKGLLEMVEQEGLSAREAAEEIAGSLLHKKRLGFLIFVNTPVTSNHRVGAYTFSWGHCYCEWLYVPTFEQIPEACANWAAERLATDKALQATKEAAHEA